MKNNFFFLVAFLYTAVMYGQDSAARNAAGKQGDITNTTSEKVNTSDVNQSKKDAQSVNTTEVTTNNVSGNLNDRKRNAVSEKNTTEGPK